MQKNISSMKIFCPACGGEAEVFELEKSIPRFGKALFSTFSCRKCSFKHSDVLPLERKKSAKYVAKVCKPKDLEIKVVKSGSAFVEIPELGTTIRPAAFSEGYYTNIEGLLERIMQAAEVAFFGAKNKKEKTAVENFLKKLKKAKDGKLCFKVVLSDPFGNSALIGKNVKKSKI